MYILIARWFAGNDVGSDTLLLLFFGSLCPNAALNGEKNGHPGRGKDGFDDVGLYVYACSWASVCLGFCGGW